MRTLHALIIEDDADSALIFTEAPSAVGFATETVIDGKLALQRLAECVPDLVVLDLLLPHVSGKQILSAIRADARLAATKVILATADDVTAREIEELADIMLLKPISFAQLKGIALRYHTLILHD